MKHGPLPTDVVEAGELVARVDVAPVPGIRDLTGAGDAFAAGFLAATLRRGGCRDGLPRGARERGIRAREPRRARVGGRRATGHSST